MLRVTRLLLFHLLSSFCPPDCAFVLVAGGLGTRLGYSDIKVSLPVESTTCETLLGLCVWRVCMVTMCDGRSPPPVVL